MSLAGMRLVAGVALYDKDMADEPRPVRVERRTGWSRPVSVPDDVDEPGLQKAEGVVELPQHVSWSGPRRVWNLADRRQRAQVYEIVLSEGTDADVRRFIDIDELLALWDELWLAPHVRREWAAHLHRLRGVRVAC